MNKLFFHFNILIYLLLLTGCFSDPNKKANKLYVSAIAIMNNAKEKESYSMAYEQYEKAKENIELILSTYPSSNIAVNLSSGESRILNFDVTEFRELEVILKKRSKSEQDILSCALLVSDKIEHEPSRSWTYSVIASYLAGYEKYNKAMEISLMINDSRIKALSMTSIASVILNKDAKLSATAVLFLDQAKQAVGMIEDEYDKGEVLVKLTTIYANLSLFDQALKIAKNIDNKARQVEALVSIANIYKKAEQTKLAKQLLDQAKEAATKIDTETNKAYALGRIAVEYAENNQILTSNKIIADVLKIAQKEETSEFSRSSLLSKSAINYAKIGQTDKALKIADMVEDIFMIDNINNEKDQTLTVIATELARVQKFAKAIEVTGSIKRKSKKDRALSRIANLYAKAGQFDKALDIVEMLKHDSLKAVTLAEISSEYSENGMNELAEKMLDKSMELIQPVISEKNIDYELYEITILNIKSNRLSHALEIIKMLKEEDLKETLLPLIAIELAKIGNFSQAMGLTNLTKNKRSTAMILAATYANYPAITTKSLNDREQMVLRNIVQASKPIQKFWEL